MRSRGAVPGGPVLPRRVVVRAAAAGLALGALAGTAACTRDEDGTEPGSAPPPPTPPAPDGVLRADVAAAERALLDAYAVTLAAHPRLVARLQPYAEQHRAHLAAVAPDATSGGPSDSAAPGTPSPGTSAGTPRAGTPSAGGPSAPSSPSTATPSTTTPSTPPAPAPADPVAAVTALRNLEAQAAVDRLAACLAAQDPELARLLASVAACEGLHRDGLAQP